MSSGSWCSLPPLRVNPHGAPPESRTSTSRHPSRLLWSRSSGFSISQWLWSPSEYRGSLLLSKVSMELRKTPHLIKDKRSVFNNRKKKGFLDNWRKKKTFYYTTMLPSPDHTPDCNTRCPPDISAFYFARCLAHIFILDAPASLFELVGVCVCVYFRLYHGTVKQSRSGKGWITQTWCCIPSGEFRTAPFTMNYFRRNANNLMNLVDMRRNALSSDFKYVVSMQGGLN